MARQDQQQGRDQDSRQQGGNARGFASMDDEKQRAIAAEGGRAAHAQGTAHEFDSEEAREAGRKGGQARGNQSSGNQSSGTQSSGTQSSDRDMQGGDMQAGNRNNDDNNRSQQAQGRERDEQGQFTSDDDRSRGGRSNQGNSTI
jgi:general stress protein YciG